jgi:hypothetical protein
VRFCVHMCANVYCMWVLLCDVCVCLVCVVCLLCGVCSWGSMCVIKRVFV